METPPPELGRPALGQRSNFAVRHIRSAARFSRQCGQVQRMNVGKERGPFVDELTACATATIMLTVASLEANINEHLSDLPTLMPKLVPDGRAAFMKRLRKSTTLEKYEATLAEVGAAPFDRGKPPYQDVKILICIRNELIHFRPEWHDRQERHARLGKQIRYRFELDPFSSDQAVMFPDRCLSHGCAKWSVTSSVAFMEVFSDRMELTTPLARYREEFSERAL